MPKRSLFTLKEDSHMNSNLKEWLRRILSTDAFGSTSGYRFASYYLEPANTAELLSTIPVGLTYETSLHAWYLERDGIRKRLTAEELQYELIRLFDYLYYMIEATLEDEYDFERYCGGIVVQEVASISSTWRMSNYNFYNHRDDTGRVTMSPARFRSNGLLEVMRTTKSRLQYAPYFRLVRYEMQRVFAVSNPRSDEDFLRNLAPGVYVTSELWQKHKSECGCGIKRTDFLALADKILGMRAWKNGRQIYRKMNNDE